MDLSSLLGVAAVLVEGVILVLFILKLREIRRIYQAEKERLPYSVDALRIALTTTMGRRVGALIFGEVSVLFYAFGWWTRRGGGNPMGETYPGHRRNAYPAILGAVLMAVVVETAVLHLLLSLWIGWVAWIPTGLGIYSAAWLLGDFQAARLNPSLLTDSRLHLRTGLRWQADLDRTEIVGIHDEIPSEKNVKMTLLGAPDFWIECREPVVVHGLFGIERPVRFIGIGVDDPEKFRYEIQAGHPAGDPSDGTVG